MKKTTKILLISGVALLLSAGAVINFLKAAQTEAQFSDLTLANIEALAQKDLEHLPEANGPAQEASEKCDRCGTKHVNCLAYPNSGQCVPIHCLLLF